MKYRAVIFDFFGVLCAEVAPPWLATYFPPAQAKEIKETLFVAADRGDIAQEALFARLAELAGITPARFATEFQSHVRMNADMLALVGRLRGRTRLGLLTNAPAPFVRAIIDEHRIEPMFDALIVSAECRMAKPEPAIFHLMLERLDVAAGEAILIDDNADNIAAAAALGMQTHLFTSYADAARVLAG